MSSKDVLVFGATGQQGGAVADELLSGDYGEFHVRAVVRDPASDDARALADRGATVVETDLYDLDALRATFDGVDAVFFRTDPWDRGEVGELVQGDNVTTAIDEFDVEHVVFSSVAGADRETGIEHFETKRRIERRLAELDLPTTIVRPVFFMQNFERHREDILRNGVRLPIEEGVSFQMVDVNDVGRLVARALADPSEYVGETIELAGDRRTLEGIADDMAAVTGRDFEVVHHAPEDVEGGPVVGPDFFAWLNESGYGVDVEALRREYDFEPTTLREFLRRRGWDELSV